MSKRIYLPLFCLLILVGCKSAKVGTATNVKKLSAEKVIANHYNSSFNFETLNARLKVKYDDGKQSFSPSVTLRVKKDKTIWLSAKMLGISLAKVLITPEKVSYYEKINNTYFDGDFAMLSKWLGTDLDYHKVQQLLLGQTLFDLRKDKYKNTIADQKYVLKPKKDLELFEKLLLFHPATFKIFSQQIKQPKENRELFIDYSAYQKIGNQEFPKEIQIKALQEDQKTRINIDYKTVDYNVKVGFPFKIPSGYKEVTLD